MSNYTKTAIINPASSSPRATAQMSWVEMLRMQESADDFSLPVVYPHTLITLLVFITNYTILRNKLGSSIASEIDPPDQQGMLQ